MKKITSMIKTTIGDIFTPKNTSNKDNSNTNKGVEQIESKLLNIEPQSQSEIQKKIEPITVTVEIVEPKLNINSPIHKINSNNITPLRPVSNKNETNMPSHIHNSQKKYIGLYKNSKDDGVINLDVSFVIDSIIDDVVTSFYNETTINQNLSDYYSEQLDYESTLESILSENEIYSIKNNIEGIIYKVPNYLLNLRSIKTYAADSMTSGLRFGVFKTHDLIIKIDRSPEAFKCELFAMSFIGKGIIKPYNLVLPYIVKVHQYKKEHHMNFSIQPRIIDSLTIYDWIKVNYNRTLSINIYVSICINVCKSIQFLHSKSVVHGDIKPGNILIQNITNIPYLIDFGLSGIHGVSEGTGGTKPFCHPLTHNVKNDDEESYEWSKNTKQNDLWSVAMLFATIIIFKRCFNLYSEYPTDFFDFEKYVSETYIQHIPYYFRDAFRIVLINPKHRVNIKQINVQQFIDLLEKGVNANITPSEI